MAFLAGTALALVLLSSSGPAFAASDEQQPAVTASDAAAPEKEAGATATKDAATPESSSAAPQSPVTTAADPAKPASDATAASSLDQSVRQAVSGALGGKADRPFASRRDKTAAEAFYAAREYAPLWVENGRLNERAKGAIAFLGGIDADGLDPADYPAPQAGPDADAAALADAELRLTASVLAFARHAQGGRVHYSRIAADISYNHAAPEAGENLAKVAAPGDIRRALEAFLPQQAAYKALKAKYTEARSRSSEQSPPRIANGATLKVGMSDPRVPVLRNRLGVAAAGADDAVYDQALAEAVKRFQKEKKIAASGQLNAATIAAINGPRRERDADVIAANLERWRWMPRDLGATYVMVNVPDYSLKVVRNGSTIWSTRIVVGKPGKLATPVTSAAMQYITVNPTWNVPPSIIENEYLPAMAQDPTVLERMGLKVAQRPDGTVHIYQPPGDRNALGRIRFNFPNKFLVYQHDTPDKHLFAHDKRAYSHGCMRVQDPLKYGEVLLSIALPNQGWSQDRLRKMFGNAEHDIRFPTAIPVHITYQTAFVDDGGKLVVREDIYGRDARVLAVLKSDERRVADVAIDRPATTSTKPVRAPAGMRFANSDFGGNFFERIFGGGPPPPPPAPVGRRTSRQ